MLRRSNKLGSQFGIIAFIFAFLSIGFLLSPTTIVFGQGVPPVYDLTFIGNGTPVAMNNSQTIVGHRLIGGNYVPLVSINGQPWTELPAPAGAMSTFPTDVNNLDVIVGVSFSPQWNPVAVRWRKVTGGYTLEILPRIYNDPASYATAINDAGQIIGSRTALGYQPTGQGWVYKDSIGFTDLVTFGFWIVPRDINNSGIVIGGQERVNLVTGQWDVTGQGPANYNPVTSIAINSSGMIAGSSTLRSTSLWIVSAFRYELNGQWTFLAGSSRWTSVQCINSRGDIGYGELGAGLFLEGLGVYSVGALLDPDVTGAGWLISGNGSLINDERFVVTIGRNTNTGENGTVLLTPNGQVPPPTAPSGLTGLPHMATRMEPFNSIDLTWTNTSPLTRSWELQRSVAGADTWSTLSLIPPGTAAQHRDTTVGVNVTYNYRVRAIGLGGPSAWSNVITVTSPATPLDTTPPVATLLEPVAGSSVSGVVRVRSSATDNVAIEYQEISFWNQYSGQQVIIASSTIGGVLNADWDTRQLTPATYRLRAFAYDTMGNWNQSEVDVVVVTTPSLVLRVSNITLSIGPTTVSGSVKVVDSSTTPVNGATVKAIWFTPNGIRTIQTATTDGLGIASFSTPRFSGKYRLLVTEVTKAGYKFNRSGSQLSATIAAP